MSNLPVTPFQKRTLNCREHTLELGERTLIMGILNVTPDSFSDGGRYATVEKAVEQAFQMVEEGADLIDIGGESTRPGSLLVSLEEELQRVIPVIEDLKRERLPVPISIDTYKAEVASKALAAGAHIINDVWGANAEPDIAGVAATYNCPIILMHNRKPLPYQDFVEDVKKDLLESISIARQAGVADSQIILDPGIGFAKPDGLDYVMMRHLGTIADLGYPVLLGTSRKSMIRRVLERPVDQVLEGTAATVALGIAQGCDIIRVHDVAEMRRVAMVTDAIVRI